MSAALSASAGSSRTQLCHRWESTQACGVVVSAGDDTERTAGEPTLKCSAASGASRHWRVGNAADAACCLCVVVGGALRAAPCEDYAAAGAAGAVAVAASRGAAPRNSRAA